MMAQCGQTCWQLKLNANPLSFLPSMKEASSYWWAGISQSTAGQGSCNTLLWGLGLGLQLGRF